MRSTDEVPAALLDLRAVPLEKVPAMGPVTLGRLVQRARPGSPVPVPAAGFNSALSPY